MGTHIQYSKASHLEPVMLLGGPEISIMGYVNEEPEQVLKELFPKYHIIKYLDVKIPSTSIYSNNNDGLELSQADTSTGLAGKIADLYNTELVKSCERESFSNKDKARILKDLKWNSKFYNDNRLCESESQIYAVVSDLLGYQITAQEWIGFTIPPERTIKPSGGLIKKRKKPIRMGPGLC
jgi:hypothetical protein